MPIKDASNLICLICKRTKHNHTHSSHSFCRDLKVKVKCPNCSKMLQLYYMTSTRHMRLCRDIKNRQKKKQEKNRKKKQEKNHLKPTTNNIEPIDFTSCVISFF